MINSHHTYASEMLRAGVSFLAVMKLLGHTSPEMTMRYYVQTVNMCSECPKSPVCKAHALVDST
jgi:integrase